MISIICVYNDDKTLNDYLVRSINDQQDIDCELILVNNTQGTYTSAAEALNIGGTRAKGDYLVFAHQDIKLDSSHWLRDAEAIIHSLPNFGVAGVAGKKDGDGVITNIKHGSPPHFAGRHQIKEPTEVQTLDECLIITPKEVFNRIKFDETTCNDWHLYAVDYCLEVQEKGYRVFVLPFPCYHRSSGSFSAGYFSTLEKLRLKHRLNHKIIYTTMGSWHTAIPASFQKTKIWGAISCLINKGLC